MTDPLYSNRLVHQKSPYLLQHAHNPVDWYPWGDEAFQAAKDGDKPIFLSIGYATCHWCHVMERESFENLEVAELLNRSFICVKVDREELPDVDALYMEFAQSLMAGAVGWPLNLFLTPELEPFFAATYLPASGSHGLMGLIELAKRIAALWSGDSREKLLTQAEAVVDAISAGVQAVGEEMPDVGFIDETVEHLFQMADPTYGGMKGAPKFPIGYQYRFLLDYTQLTQDHRALFLADRTLEMISRGGIFDHLGGGFSRYSVDTKWIVPHFEKMLCDNALLAEAYLKGALVTKKKVYRDVCEETLNYVLSEMTDEKGGFYSAQDADTEGQEGLFYTWSYDEVIHLLGSDTDRFCSYYGMTPFGNFEGRNILYIPVNFSDFIAKHHLDGEPFAKKLRTERKRLLEERDKRPHPFKDTKVLTTWNGLMIHTLVQAGLSFDNESYLHAAVKAARFIKETLWSEGVLLRRWCDGEVKYSGTLDDYATMIRAALTLFEANAGAEWLEWALQMTQKLKEVYKEEGGAFYQTEESDENIIIRRCPFSDGAVPSGNSIHAENLIRLYQLTRKEDYLQQAEDIFKAAEIYMTQYPPSYCYMAMSLQRYYDTVAPTCVIALNSEREHEQVLRRALYDASIPHVAVVWQTSDFELEELLPVVKEYIPRDGLTTLYLCTEGKCQRPLTDVQEMVTALEKLKKL